MTEKLRRWQLTSFGLENLEQVRLPMPQAGPGSILVRVDAVSLNYRDLMVAAQGYGGAVPLPFVPASDFAGTVIGVGDGVTRWKGGEPVVSTFFGGWLDGVMPTDAVLLGGPGPGVLASHVVLDAQWASPAPATLTPVQASTLPCAALTAWFALVERGGLHAGQTVLIHGTGGVALFGVQFARMHGARVIVVSGSDDKRRKVLAAGAHHALARDGDWPADVMRLTAGRGADQVLETVGGANLGRSLTAVAQGGQVSLIGVLDGAAFSGSAYDALMRRATVNGISVGHRRALDEMVRAVDLNGLQPVVAAEYGFDEVREAFAHLQRGAFGKVVVRTGAD